MKKIVPLLTLLFMAFACNNSDRNLSGKSENDVDAARNFIRAALDGKFNQAREYLLKDSSNIQYLDAAERSYERSSESTLKAYKESEITIYTVDPVNDSTTIVVYSNSFMNDHDTLRVLRVNDEWLVDLKYLFLHDVDSSHVRMINTDSIP